MIENTLRTTIETLPPGKSFGRRSAETYVLIANRPEGLTVECGWTVPEKHADDPDSYTYNPFKGRQQTPAWIGYRFVSDSVHDAAEIYEEYKVAVTGRRTPAHGSVIGSVVR